MKIGRDSTEGEIVTVIVVGDARVVFGDCRDVLKTLADCSVDSVVTDPPYELGFMGKKWDSTGIAYDVTVWEECLRVLKPGGHVLAFGGSRTWHRMAVAIEDAGFEIRDSIAWMYGSGFPKSLDVSKAIDKAAGYQGEVIGTETVDIGIQGGSMHAGRSQKLEEREIRELSSEAKQWQGWGTALKPAFEPIVVGRKPFAKGSTVAANVLEHGVGGLNIDASRIDAKGRPLIEKTGEKWAGSNMDSAGSKAVGATDLGRWPANVILDEYSAGLLDEQSGENPSRFFYCAKASKRDRNEGLDGLEDKQAVGGGGGIGDYLDDVDSASGKFGSEKAPAKNFHPTVKPTTLMRYLIKLVTPAGGTVLDPFTGSGSTGKAALLDGYKFVGAELTEEYLPIIEGRLRWAYEQEADDETLF